MIKNQRSFQSAADGMKITFYQYLPKDEIKAVVQIVHGMSEKAARYEHVIEHLVSNGYAVYIHDHRGHGESAEFGYGNLGEGDVYLKMIRDMRSINKMAHNRHTGFSVIMLGHSMGSFLAQRYVQFYPGTVDGLILSGTDGRESLNRFKFRRAYFRAQMLLGRGEKFSPRVYNLGLQEYTKYIEDAVLGTEWLSTDMEVCKSYAEAEDLGFPFNNNGFYYLMKGFTENFELSNLACIPPQLPIYLFSGEEDPIGYYGEGVRDMLQLYKKELGMKNVAMKLYPGKRHEMFNETNKEEVLKDLVDWLQCNA